jgi:hypothetical protein
LRLQSKSDACILPFYFIFLAILEFHENTGPQQLGLQDRQLKHWSTSFKMSLNVNIYLLKLHLTSNTKTKKTNKTKQKKSSAIKAWGFAVIVLVFCLFAFHLPRGQNDSSIFFFFLRNLVCLPLVHTPVPQKNENQLPAARSKLSHWK